MLPHAFFESLLNNWRVHDCWQVIVMSDGGLRSIGTQNEVPGTHLIVNAASKGPRLAITDTCSTLVGRVYRVRTWACRSERE